MPMTTPTTLTLDFVSDVACPWCAIGLHALEQALARLAPTVQASITFQPFELNPQMGPEGQEIVKHLSAKYRISAEQIAHNTEAIRQRGAALGFTFGLGKRSRIWNTFDAHRLLHLAGTVDAAIALRLKHALFAAYFTDGLNPGEHTLLQRLGTEAGLDAQAVATLLGSDQYAHEVRQAEAFWQAQGIQSVPAVIVNRRWLISGGQPVEAFEQALREIAGQLAADGASAG